MTHARHQTACAWGLFRLHASFMGLLEINGFLVSPPKIVLQLWLIIIFSFGFKILGGFSSIDVSKFTKSKFKNSHPWTPRP